MRDFIKYYLFVKGAKNQLGNERGDERERERGEIPI